MLRKAGMDAIKFDVKGNGEAVQRYCGADVGVVWRNIGEAKRLGMHVEVVTLVIPGVNDGDDCLRETCQKHVEEAGPESPLHFTRFHPNYKMLNRGATPVKTLERAHEVAKKEGAHYVYLGNIPGHRLENTHCPSCGVLLIERHGFNILRYNIKANNECPKCGQKIPIIGKHTKTHKPWF